MRIWVMRVALAMLVAVRLALPSTRPFGQLSFSAQRLRVGSRHQFLPKVKYSFRSTRWATTGGNGVPENHQASVPTQDTFIDDVGFITDIEGSLDTFERYLNSGASVLHRVPEGHLDLRSPRAAFVFGGDLFDRGPGDLRLARDLVDLKRRHPDRVFLLMGNRDINKMRLSAELDPSYISNVKQEATFSAWWSDSAPTLSEYLAKWDLPDTRVHRLKWMLKHTLGSPNAFEFRRAELAELRRLQAQSSSALASGPVDISDEDVVQSFFDEVTNDTGSVAEYLKHAQIAAIICGTLFVHGAAEQTSLGFVPSLQTRFERHSAEAVEAIPGAQRDLPLREWVSQINSFACQAVKEWRSEPRWRPDGTRGGEALLAYQCRSAIGLKTAVVTCYLDGRNMPTDKAIRFARVEGLRQLSDPADPEVMAYLREGGVRRVVVGHKPAGEVPAICREHGCDDCGFEVISADTNYASDKAEDSRGGAWCEVRVMVLSSGATNKGSECTQARLRGDLPDGGGSYDYKLPPIGTPTRQIHGDELIGKKTADGWWIRARLDGRAGADGAMYILSRKQDGQRADNRRATREEVARQLAAKRKEFR